MTNGNMTERKNETVLSIRAVICLMLAFFIAFMSFSGIPFPIDAIAETVSEETSIEEASSLETVNPEMITVSEKGYSGIYSISIDAGQTGAFACGKIFLYFDSEQLSYSGFNAGTNITESDYFINFSQDMTSNPFVKEKDGLSVFVLEFGGDTDTYASEDHLCTVHFEILSCETNIDTMLEFAGLSAADGEKVCRIYNSFNPMDYLIYGDVDGDGVIGAADARLTVRAATGLEVLSQRQNIAADVIKEKEELALTSMDARMILRAAIGLEDRDSLPVSKTFYAASNYEGEIRLDVRETENGFEVDIIADKMTELNGFDIEVSYNNSILTMPAKWYEAAVIHTDMQDFAYNFENNTICWSANTTDDGKTEISGFFKDKFSHDIDYSEKEYSYADTDYEVKEERRLITLYYTYEEGVEPSACDFSVSGRFYVADTYYGDVFDTTSYDDASIEVVLDGTKAKLYAKNSIDLKSMEMSIGLDPAVVSKVRFTHGEDAKMISLYTDDLNAFISENNYSEIDNIYYGCYFRDTLWSSDKFKEAATEDVEINDKYFHFATITITLKDGFTQSDIVLNASADMHFCDENGNDFIVSSLPCVVNKLTPEPEETTTENGETTTESEETTTESEETTTESEETLTVHSHNYSSEITKEPSCVDIGIVTFTCLCGDKYTEDIPSKGGHKLSWTVVKPATSFAEGIKEGKCGNCSYSEKVAIEKLPEIAVKPENADDAKISDNGNMLTLSGIKTEDFIKIIPENAVIESSDGKAVGKDELIGTGMKIVMKDKSGRIVDTKVIVVPCDVDGDGLIASADARSALRKAVGLDELDEYQFSAANIEQDSEISSADARTILRAAVGLEKQEELFGKVK
ncbi:MAG: hypothetical protein IJO68_04485 [Clostridia bacterium]|nr:hypothetical protein [Clostridia bacterium]